MANDSERVEIDAWAAVFKVLFVALDSTNRVAQQGVEACPCDVGSPGMDVVYKHIHFLCFKFEVSKKVRGNL